MQCPEAQEFVSVLYDGEPVPQDAAAHIAACPACRARLKEYAELGAELRLLARAAEVAETKPLPAALRQRQGTRWRRLLTKRVLVPRFAVGLVLAALVGLSVGLGFVQAQDRGPWFQFELRLPGTQTKGANGLLSRESQSPTLLLLARSEGSDAVLCEVDLVEIRSGAVHLRAGARHIPAGEVVRTEETRQSIRDYWYIPGQTLALPVDGGEEVWLSGTVLTERPAQSPWEGPLNPKPDEIALTNPVLVKGNQLLLDFKGSSVKVEGDKAAVSIYRPDIGLLVWALKPFPGAVEGEAYRAQVRFRLEGVEHFLFSATPITGGEQPRSVWVYWDPTYTREPAQKFGNGYVTGTGDVSTLLKGSSR